MRNNINSLRLPVGMERRRCQRLHLSFPIDVSGIDAAGQSFCDRTMTGDVSDQGCRFELLRELRCGDTLKIALAPRKNADENQLQPLLFEVAWVEPSEWGWAVGAFKLQPDNIWHMVFPHEKIAG